MMAGAYLVQRQTFSLNTFWISLPFGALVALVLLANKHVGFTVAQIATDLRLQFLHALLSSRWGFHLRQPVGSLANAMVDSRWSRIARSAE